jgi:twinkle protein
MTAKEYVQTRGLEFKMQSGQIVLRVCPFCHDTKAHFYMNPEDGAFYCHKCQEKGNLITLRRHMGDPERPERGQRASQTMPRKPQASVSKAFPDSDVEKVPLDPNRALKANAALLDDNHATEYVTGIRGISQETLEHFKLGLEIDQAGSRWLTIPHFSKGKLINIKSRSLPPAEKTFRRVPGCPSILFNADAIAGADELFISEGEIDALTLWDQGIKNVVGATTGAGSFDPSWIDQLEKVKRINLVYDPDEAGQKGAREAARRLGYDRCFNVVLPGGQDVNEFFKSDHDVFEFHALVHEARRFDVAGIMSFQDALQKFRSERSQPDQTKGLSTGLPSVDRIIRQGFQPGELVVVSAPPKTGKSSFALQIITNKALAGLPSLFFCLEMKPMRVIQKIIQAHTRCEEPGVAEIDRTRREFRGKSLYLGYSYQKPDLPGIVETLKAAIRRYGLKLLAFDHLHFLCRSINNQVQEIGLAVQAFKFLAEEMEIPVILIAQPRKIQADAIMTAMDLKDSASIFSDCDHLIILHRERTRKTAPGTEGSEDQSLRNQALDPVTLCRIEGSRYSAGGEALLYFHGEYSRFEEMPLHKKEDNGGEFHRAELAGRPTEGFQDSLQAGRYQHE